LELAIENGLDRFTLAMDAIKRVPKLQRIGSSALESFRNEQIACQEYAFKHGIDKPDITNWKWAGDKPGKAA
jgi:xylulose-5-phosphate/fructose-6-phosphate phosphoketolase